MGHEFFKNFKIKKKKLRHNLAENWKINGFLLLEVMIVQFAMHLEAKIWKANKEIIAINIED